jgi:signal transduction histidine kinase
MENKESIDIYFTYLIGTTVILVFAVALIGFFWIYRKKIYEKELMLQRKESEHRLDLLKTSIEVTEKERQRIASDLHDEIGSHLSTVRMALNNIKSQVQQTQELLYLTNDAKAIIDITIASVRTISHDLNPPGLEKFGFWNTAIDLCNRIAINTQIKIQFDQNEDFPISHKASISLYRILQELLSNAVKHSSASIINVSLIRQGEIILFSYKDNGKGFDTKEAINNGLGLKSIQSRVEALSGKCKIIPNLQKGLSVDIEIPFSNN